jgi:hypothetical protein
MDGSFCEGMPAEQVPGFASLPDKACHDPGGAQFACNLAEIDLHMFSLAGDAARVKLRGRAIGEGTGRWPQR